MSINCSIVSGDFPAAVSYFSMPIDRRDRSAREASRGPLFLHRQSGRRRNRSAGYWPDIHDVGADISRNYLRDRRVNGIVPATKINFHRAAQVCHCSIRVLDALHISQAGLHDRIAALAFVVVSEYVIVA